MTKIKKLEILVGQWEKKIEEIRLESQFARKHKFDIQAQILYDKVVALEEFVRDVRMKVIEEMIDV